LGLEDVYPVRSYSTGNAHNTSLYPKEKQEDRPLNFTIKQLALTTCAEEPHCIAARGGVYSPQESSDWSPLGIWQLGLNYLGYGGNGDYGRDRINMRSPLSDKSYIMDDVLIATINTSSYLNGLFGLGITQGNFNGTVADSPLTQAVAQYGFIPSYSFGYTAGAYYSMLAMDQVSLYLTTNLTT
jgi:hypothetical protein